MFYAIIGIIFIISLTLHIIKLFEYLTNKFVGKDNELYKVYELGSKSIGSSGILNIDAFYIVVIAIITRFTLNLFVAPEDLSITYLVASFSYVFSFVLVSMLIGAKKIKVEVENGSK